MIKDLSGGGLSLESVAQRMNKEFGEAYGNTFAKAVPGLDMHIISAALMFGTGYDLVTTDQRAKAKSRTFGYMYDPKAKWQLPPEAELMRIYTDEQKAEIAKELGVEPTGLYQAIVKKFGGN